MLKPPGTTGDCPFVKAEAASVVVLGNCRREVFQVDSFAGLGRGWFVLMMRNRVWFWFRCKRTQGWLTGCGEVGGAETGSINE